MRLSIVLLTVLVSSAASAQIVNVQAKFADKPDPGLHGVLSLALDWRTGVRDYLSFKGGLAGSLAGEEHVLLAIAAAEYGVSRGDTTLSKAFEHLRYRYLASDWLVPEAFIQHEFDEFRLIALRALGGVGARLKLEDTEGRGLSIGVMVMVDYETIAWDDPDPSDPDQTTPMTDTTVVPRLSTYVVGRIELLEGFTVSETVYVQPRLDAFGDLKLLSQSQLTVTANDYVSISMSVVVAYDTAPPEDTRGNRLVKRQSTQVKTALAFTF